MYIQNTPAFSDCVFVSCKGDFLGAGAFVGKSTKTSSFIGCSDCIFIKNTNVSSTSDLYGGGLYLDIYAYEHVNSVSNLLFTKNSVNNVGGGLRIYARVIGYGYSVQFCFFSDNSATGYGQDINLGNMTCNSFIHCLTTSDSPDRLYLDQLVYETSSSTDTTHIPNWLPKSTLWNITNTYTSPK